jgi:hypothetical protein
LCAIGSAHYWWTGCIASILPRSVYVKDKRKTRCYYCHYAHHYAHHCTKNKLKRRCCCCCCCFTCFHNNYLLVASAAPCWCHQSQKGATTVPQAVRLTEKPSMAPTMTDRDSTGGRAKPIDTVTPATSPEPPCTSSDAPMP